MPRSISRSFSTPKRPDAPEERRRHGRKRLPQRSATSSSTSSPSPSRSSSTRPSPISSRPTSSEISEGVLGVSEPVLHRIGIHGDMALDELQSSDHPRADPHLRVRHPLGQSRRRPLRPQPAPALDVRGALRILHRRMVVLVDAHPPRHRAQRPHPRLLRIGRARFPLSAAPGAGLRFRPRPLRIHGEPLRQELGPRVLRVPEGGLAAHRPARAAEESFRLEPREFAQEFKKYLRPRFKDYFGRENPEDYSVPLGPEFPMNPYYFAFSHAVSPSGDLVATITSTPWTATWTSSSSRRGTARSSGTSPRAIRPSTNRIKYEIDPSLGKSLAWSRDGDRLAFFARDGQKHALFHHRRARPAAPAEDPTRRRPARSGPAFHPDGRKMLFSAFEKGLRDIFAVDLRDGEIANLTRDALYEKAPAISPDGRSVAYSIRVGTYDKLFLSPIDDFRKKTQLTFGRGNTITPEFSADGRTAFFSGDARDAYQHLLPGPRLGRAPPLHGRADGEFLSRRPLPNAPDSGHFLVVQQGRLPAVQERTPGAVEQTLTFADAGPAENSRTYAPALTVEIDEDKIQALPGMGKLYISDRAADRRHASRPTDRSTGARPSPSRTSWAITSSRSWPTRSASSAPSPSATSTRSAASSARSTPSRYSGLLLPLPLLLRSVSLELAGLSGRHRHAEDHRSERCGLLPLEQVHRLEGSFGFFNYEEEFFDPCRARRIGVRGLRLFHQRDMLTAAFPHGRDDAVQALRPGRRQNLPPSLSPGAPRRREIHPQHDLGSRSAATISTSARMSSLAFRFRGLHAASAATPSWATTAATTRSARPIITAIAGHGDTGSPNAEFRFPLISTASTIIGTGRARPRRPVLRHHPEPIRDVSGEVLPPGRRPGLGDVVILLTFDAIGSFGYGIEFFVFGLPGPCRIRQAAGMGEHLQSLQFQRLRQFHDEVLDRFRFLNKSPCETSATVSEKAHFRKNIKKPLESALRGMV